MTRGGECPRGRNENEDNEGDEIATDLESARGVASSSIAFIFFFIPAPGSVATAFSFAPALTTDTASPCPTVFDAASARFRGKSARVILRRQAYERRDGSKRAQTNRDDLAARQRPAQAALFASAEAVPLHASVTVHDQRDPPPAHFDRQPLHPHRPSPLKMHLSGRKQGAAPLSIPQPG